MLSPGLAPAPFPPATRPSSVPTPRERQLTWAAILGSLAVFWSLVGLGAHALWVWSAG